MLVKRSRMAAAWAGKVARTSFNVSICCSAARSCGIDNLKPRYVIRILSSKTNYFDLPYLPILFITVKVLKQHIILCGHILCGYIRNIVRNCVEQHFLTESISGEEILFGYKARHGDQLVLSETSTKEKTTVSLKTLPPNLKRLRDPLKPAVEHSWITLKAHNFFPTHHVTVGSTAVYQF